MSKYSQSPTSLSIDALEEIVRNCQRNEERLYELERHTRHERKKAERLLQETYRTMQDGSNSRNISILENKTNNDSSYVDNHRTKREPGKRFYVSLDDENEENENNHIQPRPIYSNIIVNNNNNNNNKSKEDVNPSKHLLDRVEKLLAGDGTTTSSDIMSSQERQKKIAEKSTSPVEDDLEDKSLDTDQKDFSESHQQQSECSIDYDLSTVDHLLSERTPINSHRRKGDIRFIEGSQTKQNHNYNEEKKVSSDRRDQQFFERFNNYIETDHYHSPTSSQLQPPPPPPPTTTTTAAAAVATSKDQTYRYNPQPTISNQDEELTDLARRCEDLLARLQSQRTLAAILENSSHKYDYYRRPSPSHTPINEPQEHYHYNHRSISTSPTPSSHPISPPLTEGPPPMSLQQALELLRPEFISRSRQRARRIRLLREEREQQAEIEYERQQMLLFSCTTCCANTRNRAVSSSSSSTARRNIAYTVPYERYNSPPVSSTYREMKQATKKKYDQLPEVNNRRRQNQMEEIRRRNLLRAKVFRARLRQHVRHGRTNFDESLSIIDT